MPSNRSTCRMPLLSAQLENEENSDVTFLVGSENDYRVPGHRSILAAASPVFRAMFDGPLAEGPVVTIQDVEPRAFDNLLRFIYIKKIQLQSVGTALSTLYAAHKYQCERLERNCLSYLSSRLNTSFVLPIFHNMFIYCNIVAKTPNSISPSAPSLDVIESRAVSESRAETLKSVSDFYDVTQNIFICYQILLNECLQYIDLHADEVLQQEYLDELNKEELLCIIQRDTFHVSSELLLFTALDRWSKFQCKCNHWELAPEKCRKALGEELLYSVRYLLMNSEDFMNGPMQSKLLSPEECNVLLGHILSHTHIANSPDFLKKHISALAKKRENSESKLLESNFCRSGKTEENANGPSDSSVSSINLRFKKNHKKKRELQVEGAHPEERKPNMADYFFSCVACIFD